MANTAWWSVMLFSVLCVEGDVPVQAATARGRPRNMQTRLSLKFYNIEHCKDKEHDLRIHNVSIYMHRTGDSWDVDFEILKPAKSISSMEIVLHHCLGAITPSMCEYHTKWSWAVAVCPLIRMPGMIWTPLVQGIHPPLLCPMSKGHYSLRNATVDISSLDRPGVDIDKYIWLVEIRMTNDQRQLYLCFKFALEARRVKA